VSRSGPGNRPPRPGKEEGSEGWESLAEDADGGSLAPSEELERALREATEAVEARSAARSRGETPTESASGDPSAPDVDALQAELNETRDRWIRLNADFENFRRRTLKEREEAHQFGHQALAKDLLPAVDNLERATEAARKSGVGDLESLLQGLELVQRDLESVLAKHGVTEVEALGQPFDPSMHEAIAQLPDDSVPANTVVKVFQRGYRLRDRLLRPAQVVVSKAGEASGN
jgi:molecular chaperone GrpE